MNLTFLTPNDEDPNTGTANGFNHRTDPRPGANHR